jgi:hypothetical protein
MSTLPPDGELLARILQDPETGQIAESLGLEPVDYAARVLHYLKNPNAQPQMQVMTPEQEREAGMPSTGDVVKFFEDIDSGAISLEGEHEKTRYAGFDDDEKSAVTVAGGNAVKRAPAPAPSVAAAPAAAPKRGLKK